MQDPLNRVFRRGGWASDNLGTQVPLGSNSDAKELLQLPQDMRKFLPAANTLIRGNLSRELWPRLAKLLAIAGDHALTKRFIVAVAAGSMSENGQATTNTLQAMVNMLAVPALSPTFAHPQRRGDGHTGSNHDGRIASDE
jgi:hypothetical protein